MTTALAATINEHNSNPFKGRGSLTQMVRELERQRDTRLDFVADTRTIVLEPVAPAPGKPGHLRMMPAPGHASDYLPPRGYTINGDALAQICGRVDPSVPVKFGRELVASQPGTAAELLNRMMSHGPARRLFRVLDGTVRAVLSDRYRCVDNLDLAFSALETAKDVDARVLEASLSERFMRIKLVRRDLWDAVESVRMGDSKSGWFAGGLGRQEYLSRVGARTQGAMPGEGEDGLPGGPGTVHPAVTISNSETGHGGIRVRIGILHAVCFNLATVEEAVGAIHVGERIATDGIFTAETVTAETKAIMLKCRDAIQAAFHPAKFAAIVEKCREAQGERVLAPAEAVDFVVTATDIQQAERDALLMHFGDYDRTRWGLAQAVARLAQDVDDGDRACDMEDLAGKLALGTVRLPAAMVATA